jgi:hypothetical protein
MVHYLCDYVVVLHILIYTPMIVPPWLKNKTLDLYPHDCTPMVKKQNPGPPTVTTAAHATTVAGTSFCSYPILILILPRELNSRPTLLA